MDRRILRTRRALRGALLDLIQEKAIEEITVQEIADRADTARITFYRHYRDKHELLLDCLEQIYVRFQEQLVLPEAIEEEQAGQLVCRALEMWYGYVAEDRAFFKKIFGSSMAASVRAHIRLLVVQQTVLIMQRTTFLPSFEGIPVDALLAYTAEAQIGLLVWWLETDSTYSTTLLAEMSTRLMETGVFGLIGREPTEGDISYLPLVANVA